NGGTDWQDVILDPSALGQQYNLSISGGTDQLTYFVAGGLAMHNGIIRGSRFNRSSVRVNLNDKVSNNLKIVTRLSGTFTKRLAVPTSTKAYGSFPNIITDMISSPPTIPVRVNGKLSDFSNYPLGRVENPLNIAYNYKNNRKGSRFLGTIYGEYNFTKGLSLKVKLGTNFLNYRQGKYYPIGSLKAGSKKGVAIKNNNHVVGVLNENTLRYNTTINEK